MLAERNASERTVEGYEIDLEQFAAFRWGPESQPPFDWTAVTPEDARAFLMAFARDEARATTTRRKLASMRTFFRFLSREGKVPSNPFGGLRGPKLPKPLPKVLSQDEVRRLIEAPGRELARRKAQKCEVTQHESYACLRDTALFESLYSTWVSPRARCCANSAGRPANCS